MGLLTRRKNKRFDYEPRYHKMEEGARPFEIKHKFDDYRTTVGKNTLRNRFDNAVNDYNTGSDAATKKRLYIIIAVLIIFFLWLIEFDLSIFKFKI